MAEKKTTETPTETTKEAGKPKTPAAWGAELELDPATVAGVVVRSRWDRVPGLEVTRAEFEKALGEFEGVSVGGDVSKPDAKKDEVG